MNRIIRNGLTAITSISCIALFGCGSSNSASEDVTVISSASVGVCGEYTAQADGLGNTFCFDASGALIYSVAADGTVTYAAISSSSESTGVCGAYTSLSDGQGTTYCMDAAGAIVYYVLADGTIVYATAVSSSSVESGTVSSSSDSSVVTVSSSSESYICGETTAPISIAEDLYFYTDASGVSYYYNITDATCTKTYLSVVSSSSAASSDSSVPASSSSESYICGETTAPLYTIDTKAFYTDAFGVSYYYETTDATCTKVYLSVTSSSSAETAGSSSSVAAASSSSIVAVSSSGAAVSSSSAVGASSSSVVTVSSSSVVSTGSDPKVTYSGTSATVTDNNNCVTISGTTVTISCAGNYYFSGSSTDGQIIVAADTSAKVYLYLNGLSLASASDAPIYAQSSDKTFIIAVSGTTNTLSDASTRTKTWTYTKNGESKSDTTSACIYAKDDLTIKGAGTLTVTGNYNNGIQTSNDLKVKYDSDFSGAPTVNVTATDNALKGKGSVEIDGGTFTLTAGGDGIKSDEDDATDLSEGKGHVMITGGTFTIKATDDGIDATNYVLFDDSTNIPSLNITAGTGTPNTSKSDSQQGGGGGQQGGWGSSSSTSTTTSYPKGVKADSSITLNTGTVTINSEGNCFSGKKVYVNEGTYTLAGRRGAHADDTLFVTGGQMVVSNSYEGFEAAVIYMKGGITSVYATDDGWNASNSDNTALSSKVLVTGGYHYVKTGSGDVDGIDSNGELNISGGVVVVECQINGGMGGALDADGTVSITGGYVLGFGTAQAEAGTNYTVSFNTSSYYGSSSAIAFKPTISGSYIASNFGQPSTVGSVSGMNSVCFTTGNCVYYK